MREAPAEGYNYIFGLRSSNTSTADAADFAIKKTSAREVLFMVPVSRLTSLCFVAASSQGRRYPRLACSSWSNYRFGSSSCYINTIKKNLRKGGSFYGAACVNRTRDNTITNRVLYVSKYKNQVKSPLLKFFHNVYKIIAAFHKVFIISKAGSRGRKKDDSSPGAF